MKRQMPKEFVGLIKQYKSKMPHFHYWKRIVKEVQEQHNHHFWFCFTNPLFSKDKKNPSKNKRSKYYLGERYPTIYFSQREAECMVLLLSGYKLTGAADYLGISIKTVDCYASSIKQKMGCRHIKIAVQLIKETEFMLQLDKVIVID